VWAGVDSAWEQEKLKARKMLDAKRAAESPASSARFVGQWRDYETLLIKGYDMFIKDLH